MARGGGDSCFKAFTLGRSLLEPYFLCLENLPKLSDWISRCFVYLHSVYPELNYERVFSNRVEKKPSTLFMEQNVSDLLSVRAEA